MHNRTFIENNQKTVVETFNGENTCFGLIQPFSGQKFRDRQLIRKIFQTCDKVWTNCAQKIW